MRWRISITVLSLVLLSMFSPGITANYAIADDDFYEELKVEEPVIFENLAVFPITLPGGGEKLGDLLTMGEAMESGKFKIVELPEEAEVNFLKVDNRTGKNVVLFAGEMIRGAKQDRIIAYDTVVPSDGEFDVDVYCVEAGRWAEVSDSFEYNQEIAPSSVRYTAQGENDQGKVWEAVAKCNKEMGTITESDALTASYSDEAYKKKVEDYITAFESISKDKDVVGVIVVSNGEVQAGDIFAGHDLFARVWSRLLSSFAMDAALAGDLGEVPGVSEIAEYLVWLNDANRETTFEDDDINRAELAKGDMEGYELEYKNKKMHVNVFKMK